MRGVKNPVVRSVLATLFFPIFLGIGCKSAHKLSDFAEAGIPQPAIAAVGTVHGFHLKADYKYSLSDLGDLVRVINPNLISAEVAEDAWQGEMEGYFPPEDTVIAAVATDIGATFYPSDWRGSKVAELKASKAMTPDELKRRETSHDGVKPLFAPGADLMEAVHAFKNESRFEEAHRIAMEIGSEVSDGYWIARNQLIVKQCMRKAKELNARKVLFTFGGEHIYAIRAWLKAFYNLELQPIVIPDSRRNEEVNESIVAVWQKNLGKLEGLAARSDLDEETRAKLDNSNRVAELKNFIALRGKAK